ncbi:hypothetical protein EDB85DRAFT_2158946 [Lactarius pseudohatsudake]|nr:hypothetical protein EDB85DRAFT_2158946 [Lactarius pseudohatsudake]
MMNDSTTVRLICVLIGDDLKIRGSSFTITVPSEEDFGGVIDYVKEATPSVRDKDHGNFRFYKPPLDNPISVSQSLHGFPLTREYLGLGSALLITSKVSEECQKKDADRRFNIDVIVHVDSGEHGGVALRRLSVDSSNSLLRHVTFRLRNCDEVQLLPEARLFDNNISELPIDEALPDFVQQLERELRLWCSPKHDMIMPPLLDSVKMLLGDDVYPKYFTDTNDESETRRVTAVELVHYIDILLDQHLSNQEAYRDKSVSHIYSLLRRFAVASPPQRGAKFQFDVPWPFSLTAEIIQGDTLYQYTPCSSFSISTKRFPFLLLGVSSGTSQTEDVHFMLLQASCLVRLGNALLMDKSSTFVVKAIHVNHDYYATEYTLYKKGSGPDDKVEYWKRSYDFSNRRDMFTLIFRIYNFLHSTRSLHDKFPSQLTMALASILTETENLPRLTRMHGSDGSGPSKRWDQESRDPSTTRITLRNPGLQALIQTDGYTLLPEGSMQLKPTIGKALSNHGRAGTVALKLLDNATEELQILSHLQTIQSELNHTIRLLDLIQLNIPPPTLFAT